MKTMLFALLCLLGCSLTSAAQPSNAWSSQDYNFYAGDFNGDGFTDILFVARNSSLPSGILLSDGNSPTILGQTWPSNYLGIPWSSGSYTVVVGDFNGDGKTDILLQSNSPGDSYLLLTDSTGAVSAISQTIPAYAMGMDWSARGHYLVVGDFNGDGHADLFLQPTIPGGTSAVVYSDTNGQFTSSTPAQSWADGYLGFLWSTYNATVLAGDFNGDGRADLLIQAWPDDLGSVNNEPVYAYPVNMNGVITAQTGATPFTLSGTQAWSRYQFGVDWSPLSNNLIVGDFNGDGRADVLFQPLVVNGVGALLDGNATGAIFTAANASLGASVDASAGSVTLISGNYSGGKSAALLIQSNSRSSGNAIANSIASGIHANSLALPTLSASSITSSVGSSATTIGTAPSGVPQSSSSVQLAATMTPTSAGRTAGQFSISPTGAATYNIPLWTPPGAREIEPHLALHYTSGGPDGSMGAGWAISGLSMITRCAKTWISSGGAPAPVALTTSDDFCLDGNRLILTGGTQGASGSTYQTLIADFSNVTANGTQGNGPQYFIVQGKDGHTYEYGNTTDSRIYGSGATTPYAWALNKVRDRQNNSMTVAYSSSAGTALTPSKIQYTNTPGTSNTAPYEVDFSYVARTGGTAITKYVAGGSVTQTQQLSYINVLASGTAVRKYLLGYAASSTTNRPILQTVQECGGSSGSDCLRPTTISYQSGSAGWSPTATATGATAQYGFIPLDLNGDGIPDILYANVNGSQLHWYARLGTSTGYASTVFDTGVNTNSGDRIIPGYFGGVGTTQFLAPQSGTWYCYTFTGSGFTKATTGLTVNGEQFAVDWDGDGLPDLVAISQSGTTYTLSVRRNITSPSGTVTFATTTQTLLSASYQLGLAYWSKADVPADFNGDGRGDLFVIEQGHVSPIYFAVMSNGFSTAPTIVNVLPDRTLATVVLGDVNGDGCTDVIEPTSVYLSNCNGTFTQIPTNISLPNPLPTPFPSFMAVDWDGDGQTDILYTDTASKTWYVARSTGNGVAAAVPTGIPAPSTRNYYAIDQNSDGQMDLGYVDTSNGYAVSYYPHMGANTPPDLSTSISDGFGISFSPTYVPISHSNYVKGTGAVFPDIDFDAPMYVVSQYAASDGIGGTYTNTMDYYYAQLSLQGLGFKGFQVAIAQDSRNGVYQYKYYRRDYPFIGSVYADLTLEPDNKTYMSYTSYSYNYTSLAGTACSSRCFPYVNSSTKYNYEATGPKAGSSISNTVTSYTYDSYGNLTDTKATTTDTDSGASGGPASPFNGQQWITEVKNTITNDTSSNWCLGRPSTTTTTKTVPNQTAQTRTVNHTIDYANCRATVETVEPNDSHLKVTTTFGFDACGNTNSISVVGLDQNGNAMPARTTTTSYGTRCQLPESVTNALNQKTSTQYNYNFGLPSSVTDPNSIITTAWQYDDFGRKTQETKPDGTYTETTYSDCVTDPCWGAAHLRFLVVNYLYNSSSTVLRTEEKFYDGLDRQWYEEGNRVLGAWDVQIFSYDNLGRRTIAYVPYSANSNGYHQYTYDIGNRLTQDALYTNTGTLYRTISIGYSGQTTTFTDPNGNTITKVSDVAAKIRAVTDPSTSGTIAGTTNYTFDPFGNLITVVDADAVTSSYAYNIRGFKTTSTDADTGTWVFTPDSLNELVSQKDAKGQVISMTYDLLGRMTTRTEPESSTATQWTYGTSAAAFNIGRVQQVTKPDGYAESYGYDSAGRVHNVTYTEDGTNYPFTYAYNINGTVDTIQYPVSTSGYQFTLKNVYDTWGFLNQIKDNTAGTVFWTLNSASDASLPTLETFGNGVEVASVYTPWTNEISTRTEGSAGSTTNLQNLTYNWDLAGNLHQRIDNRQNLTEQFSYDSMNRMLGSTLNGASNLALTYDAAGNIKSKSDVSASSYAYGDPAHKHAVTAAGSWSMSYDANGNMITRAGGSITWYSYNQPNTITYSGNSTQFFYNANHQRWKQIANYAGTVETTHYIGGLLEVMTRGSGPTEYRHQITGGSAGIVYTRRTDGSTATYYATADHLGSSDLVLDSAANVQTRESFTQFGARRGSNWTGVPTTADYTAFGNTTRKGFTGHEMLDSVSLVHMNGRVFDPYLGRFLSADTVIQSLGATESINPYAYAWNNPLRYVDPSGHSLLGDILGAIVGIVAAILAPELVAAFETSVYGVTLTGTSLAMIGGFVGGFTGALIATGNLSAALTAGLISGITAGIFNTLGSFAQNAADSGNAWTKSDFVLVHAAVGCLNGVASGGNCGRSAAAAALSEAAVQSTLIKPAAIGTWGSYKGAAEAGLVGGATAAITGGNFNDGFSVAAAGYLFDAAAHSDLWTNNGNGSVGLLDVLGKIWSFPSSAIGLLYGSTGYAVGWGMYEVGLQALPPDILPGENAIQFTNNPFARLGAITLGNVEVFDGSPSDLGADGNVEGIHEMQHTYQGQMLGPLYLPSNILGGAAGLLFGGDFHAPQNWNELGPQMHPPQPWP